MGSNNYLPKGYLLKNYEIKSVLGAGGFGVTYLARDVHLETEVVIKEFLPQEFSTREVGRHSVIPYTDAKENSTYEYLLKKFLKEAQILASIKHPNVVRVFSFFEENNTAYFVMDYISGESLKSYIERKKNINESEILSIVLPLLEGLKEVHRNNYLHRDIAPDNIYLRENGMSMLIDFGAAKNATRQESTSLASIVKSGYSAPEQYTSNAKQTNATDIYAIGSVLYSMISGKVAPESTIRQMAILNDESDPLEDVRKSSNYSKKYSKKLLETIHKAMQIRGKDRFQDVTSIQESIYAGVHSNSSQAKQIVKEKKNWTKKLTYTLLPILGLIGFLSINGLMDDNQVVESTQSKPINILNEPTIKKPIVKNPKIVNIKTLKEKCESGYGSSCSLLANKHYANNDRTSSLMFAKKACDLDDGKGCGYYASLLVTGIGVPLNEKKALKISIKACDLNNAIGCIVHSLIHFMEIGGVKTNKKEEHKLSKKARNISSKDCDLNDSEGCANLGSIYLIGLGTSIDLKKSFSFFEKACKLGDNSSCTDLGNFYFHGIENVVLINQEKAKKLYQKACSLGHGDGCANIFALDLLEYDKKIHLIKDDHKNLVLAKKACNSMYSGLACSTVGGYYAKKGESKKEKLFFKKSCDLRYELGCDIYNKKY